MKGHASSDLIPASCDFRSQFTLLNINFSSFHFYTLSSEYALKMKNYKEENSEIFKLFNAIKFK